VIRDDFTTVLHHAWGFNSVYKLAVPFLSSLVRSSKTSLITTSDPKTKEKTIEFVDLCSGGGGPAAEIAYEFSKSLSSSASSANVRLTFSDLFPNIPAFTSLKEQWAKVAENNKSSSFVVDFCPTPLDATQCQLKGIRTLYGSFHHFERPLASAILTNASSSQCSIFVCEPLTRTLHSFLVTIFGVPLLSFLAPFIDGRFSFPRLLFTYIIPILPLMLSFDGFVSTFRAYTPMEFMSFISDGQSEEHRRQTKWRLELMEDNILTGWYYTTITPTGYVWKVGCFTHYNDRRFLMPTITFATGYQSDVEKKEQ